MVLRDVNRWATAHGYRAGFPTFEEGNGPTGPVLGVFTVANDSPVGLYWQDVRESDLRVGRPQPHRELVSVDLTWTEHRTDPPPPLTNVWLGTAGGPNLSGHITSVTFRVPSAWQVNTAIVTHGSTQHVATNVMANQMRTDFNGESPAGEWWVTITASNVDHLNHPSLEIITT